MDHQRQASNRALTWHRIMIGMACLLALFAQPSGQFGTAGARINSPEVALEPAQFTFPYDVVGTPAPGGTANVVGLIDSSQAGTSISEIDQKRLIDSSVRILKWYVLRLDVRDIYTIKLLSPEGKNVDLWLFVPAQSPRFPLGLKLIDYSATPLPAETIGPRMFEADMVQSQVTGDMYDQSRLFIGISIRGSTSFPFGSPIGLTITRREPNKETLIGDDATSEHGIVQNNLAVVSRLTPTRYPAKLETIQFITGQVEGAANPVGSDVRVIVFADPFGFGKPPQRPQLLFDKTVTIQRLGLSEVKVDSGPVITTGDFYIGYQIPQNSFGVAVNFDTDGPPRRRSFSSTDNLMLFSGPIVVVDLQGKRFDANALFRGIISNQ